MIIFEIIFIISLVILFFIPLIKEFIENEAEAKLFFNIVKENKMTYTEALDFLDNTLMTEDYKNLIVKPLLCNTIYNNLKKKGRK